jgi:hypothetical protein
VKIINTFYYYYYLFYKRILHDPDPHIATLLALSLSESLLIVSIADTLVLWFYCYSIKPVFYFVGTFLIVIINYHYYIINR